MHDTKIPSYIATLVKPTSGKANEKRAWNIGVHTDWLPFFTATNLMGATFLPAEALGCPIRLSVGKDGVVKMGANGVPKTVICKEIRGAIAGVQANFIANLRSFTAEVKDTKTEAYASLVESCRVAGQPVAEKQNAMAMEAIKAYAEASAEETFAQPERELVGASA
jgi:hypothetical protein